MESCQSSKTVKKLVLCFDGTGNTFSGTSGDTNIVKLYDKFNRDDPHQFHYYQTGIGTYDINSGSVNKGILGSIRSSISRALDQGFGTSFDNHVMAGYKFLMNHYNAGIKTDADPCGDLTSDKIYMFGFSRGAYTARFLARMINTVGLLSGGNDEMVPFAYQLYQRYEAGEFAPKKETAEDISGKVKDILEDFVKPKTIPANPQTQEVANEIKAFRNTFCRVVKVYFLGIFDCVNSVAVLENPREPATVLGTATHVRHAVAVDEFRVKFKPSLLQQDVKAITNVDESVKEVWFPGNHGDVGGGWPILEPPKGFWEGVKRSLSTLVPLHRGTSADPNNDDCQMSDIPLDWMIRELDFVNKENVNKGHPEWSITFSGRKRGFKRLLASKMKQAKQSPLHDTVSFGRGLSPFKVIMWNIMEYLPLILRYELDSHGRWVTRRWTPNQGSARDIPKGAVLHQSIVDRMSNPALNYRPRNNHGDNTKLCLLDDKGLGVAPLAEIRDPGKPDGFHALKEEDKLHRTYTFPT